MVETAAAPEVGAEQSDGSAINAAPEGAGRYPTRRVPSDDCVVAVEGELCYPHRGEWVEVVVGVPLTMAEARAMLDIEVTRDDPNADLVIPWGRLCGLIAQRIVSWTWTNPAGFPRPQPNGTAAPIEELPARETYYLRDIVLGEGPADRKNGSVDTPTTSSATTEPTANPITDLDPGKES